MLSDRARFARQLLVPEIGEAGQAKLSATRFSVAALAPEAAAVARLYLERAGLREGDPDEVREAAREIPCAAGEDPAADALAGARFAVRTIRDTLDQA
ncbi:MAG: hypothetical protein CMN30_00635 [Sandaracinus sp.]|nr:hypothetical protein [Sandaracinus sp.]